MPFTAPPTIPQLSFAPYSSQNLVYSGLPNYPPAGCVISPIMQAHRALNDEFVALKARLLTLLQRRRLPNMPRGFPFHLVPSEGADGFTLSQSSYEFSECIFVDQWSAPSYAVFSYTAPGYGTSQGGPSSMTWRVLIPSRESLRPSEPITCESQVTLLPIF
jgi:hypothetical protein